MSGQVVESGYERTNCGFDAAAASRDARLPEVESGCGRQTTSPGNPPTPENHDRNGRPGRRAYVYKLKPNRAQVAYLDATLETCRRLYNDCLAERKEAWEQRQESITASDQKKSHVTVRRKDCPYLSAVNSQILQDVVNRLDRSFQGFFRRVKSSQTPGYPRFKGRGQYDSFTDSRFGWGTSLIRLPVSDIPSKYAHVYLASFGWIKMFYDQPIQGKAKTATFRRRPDGWYVIISCEVLNEDLPATGQSVGVDLGIEAFATLSNGERIENPRHMAKNLARLKRANRRQSRRSGPDKGKGKKASKRWVKAKRLLAKQHEHVRRARQEFHRRVTHDLVNRFDTIAVENLNVAGMVRNHCLARHISDAGWGLFIRTLESKAESAGRQVVKVPPHYTSQTCSGCGQRVPKKLSQRWHDCPFCGLKLHRDVNAARNIQERAESSAFGDGGGLPLPEEPRTAHA